MYEVTIKKTFSAAHTLTDIGGKCEELHGHNFTVEVSVASRELNEEGLILDFRTLKGWTEEIFEELDHKLLNDIPYFKNTNPSSENIARFIYDRIYEKAKSQKFKVSRVTVWESEDARASYEAVRE
ncbi:MAG: 6-carboxytetrahydropterin synthase QueD [Proteobacteria bacterium]|nr:6-carboxytetrahydropterin synthase QueD [Pseudomonadota bacterium]